MPALSESERGQRARRFAVAGRRVDPSALRITSGARSQRLEPKAMQVLLYLAKRAGEVVSRRELEEAIWPGRVLTEDALTNAIRKLRRVFADDARDPQVIETIPKTGYRLVAAVEWSDPRVAPPAGKVGAAADRPARRARRWRAGVALVAAGLLVAIVAWWLGAPVDEPDRAPAATTAVIAAKPALAVMPFRNLGAEPEQAYFANGVTADLITALSKLRGLRVIASGSVFGFRGGAPGARQAGAELGVDYVVQGSVQRAGERVRINARLVEVTSEQTLWAERFDRPLADVLKIQDEVSAGIVAALELELDAAGRDALTSRPVASVAAYDAFLRGLDHYGRRSKAENAVAGEHFARAIDLDPDFARAYAGLALVHAREAIDGWSASPAAALAQAAELAERAAALDEGNPQVQFVVGEVALFQGRHTEAVGAIERALARDPSYADAHALQAWTLNYAGRPDRALPALARARALNPLTPAAYAEILGEIRYVQGRYTAAAAALERALTINPAHTRARVWLAATYARLNRGEDAAWEVEEVLTLNPDFALSRMRLAFPFKDPLELEALLQGLRQAGLPQ